MRNAERDRIGSRRTGFTLMEMMVAVALGLIIMTVVLMVFSQAIALFRRTHATVEAIHGAQIAVNFLEGDIQSAAAETGNVVFIGVQDTAASGAGIDNDNDGVFDEDGAIGPDNDCTDFVNTAGSERHGLELVSMSLYALDDTGQPVPGEHVVYYLTRDRLTENGHEMGRLIRVRQVRDSNPVTPWLTGATLGVGLQIQEQQTLADSVLQFRLRYFKDGTWYDTWDSVAAGFQNSRLPDVVEVTLTVADSNGYLDSRQQSPFVIRRLIPVGATEP